jgi:hypothetical protein
MSDIRNMKGDLLESVINEVSVSVIAIYSDRWGGNRWVTLYNYYYSVLEIKAVDVDRGIIFCIVTIPNDKNILERCSLTSLFMEVRYSDYLIYVRDKIIGDLV